MLVVLQRRDVRPVQSTKMQAGLGNANVRFLEKKSGIGRLVAPVGSSYRVGVSKQKMKTWCPVLPSFDQPKDRKPRDVVGMICFRFRRTDVCQGDSFLGITTAPLSPLMCTSGRDIDNGRPFVASVPVAEHNLTRVGTVI